MPIAKTATQATGTEAPVHSTPPSTMSQERQTPMEMYRFFNLNPAMNEGNDKLEAVRDWAFEKGSNVGEALRQIRNLETKLGQPAVGETRLDKLSNWIRVSNSIKTTNQSMKQELDGIRNKYNAQLSEIRSNQRERLSKINDEISRLQSEHRKVYSTTKARTMSEMDRIRGEYDKQLKELHAMRQAYGGKK